MCHSPLPPVFFFFLVALQCLEELECFSFASSFTLGTWTFIFLCFAEIFFHLECLKGSFFTVSKNWFFNYLLLLLFYLLRSFLTQMGLNQKWYFWGGDIFLICLKWLVTHPEGVRKRFSVAGVTWRRVLAQTVATSCLGFPTWVAPCAMVGPSSLRLEEGKDKAQCFSFSMMREHTVNLSLVLLWEGKRK